MNQDQGLNAFYIMLALLLPLSALLSRRMPWRQVLPMAAAWIGIFVAVTLIVLASRNDTMRAGWARFSGIIGADEQRVTGRTVRVRLAQDGHFWVMAEVNGVAHRMLIDSGATTTSLSLATAHEAGLDLDQNPVPTTVKTANGMIFARTSSVRALEIGPIIARELRVVVAPEFGDTDVLGMNFLSRLKSWRVEGDMLVLEPKA